MADLLRIVHEHALGRTFIIYFLGLGLWVMPVMLCQAQIQLRYEVEDLPSRKGTLDFPDSMAREDFIQELLLSLRLEGYPAAGVFSKTFSGDTLAVRLQAGHPMSWLMLRQGNLDDSFAIKAGYEPADFHNQPFHFPKLKDFFDQVLELAQNTGYPFAAIRLDSLVMEKEGLVASVNFEPGPFIAFDTLEVTGNSRTKPLYLNRLLRIPPEAPFSQANIDRGLRSLQKVPYLQLVDQPTLTFQNQKARLLIPLDDRRINTLDGIIGVLPNEAEDNKLLVTGQFNLSLYNVSGRGRDYELQWQRLSRYSQNLALSAKEPMLLGSLLDLHLSFSLLKEDTSFLNRDFRLALSYPVPPDGRIGFFSRRLAGDRLEAPSEGGAGMGDVADFRYNNYGINLTWNTLDRALGPRTGWLAALEGGIGNKTILENTALPLEAYEGLDMKAIQHYITVSVERHLQASPSLGAWIRLRAGEMGSKHLFLNDLFRLGGLNSIRGFNENFFFAKRYVYANFEPRYYIGSYSYFLLFLDWGGMKGNNGIVDRPLSTGGGISLETEQGVFSFIYAVGKSNTQTMGFNFSKVHFGYTGRF